MVGPISGLSCSTTDLVVNELYGTADHNPLWILANKIHFMAPQLARWIQGTIKKAYASGNVQYNGLSYYQLVVKCSSKLSVTLLPPIEKKCMLEDQDSLIEGVAKRIKIEAIKASGWSEAQNAVHELFMMIRPHCQDNNQVQFLGEFSWTKTGKQRETYYFNLTTDGEHITHMDPNICLLDEYSREVFNTFDMSDDFPEGCFWDRTHLVNVVAGCVLPLAFCQSMIEGRKFVKSCQIAFNDRTNPNWTWRSSAHFLLKEGKLFLLWSFSTILMGMLFKRAQAAAYGI